MTNEKKLMLAEAAAKIRLLAVEAVYGAASGHPGGSLSIADVIAYLYFDKLNVDPADPHNPSRDRFVLSKGHTVRRCTRRWRCAASSPNRRWPDSASPAAFFRGIRI